jgi:hypothetical protein
MSGAAHLTHVVKAAVCMAASALIAQRIFLRLCREEQPRRTRPIDARPLAEAQRQLGTSVAPSAGPIWGVPVTSAMFVMRHAGTGNSALPPASLLIGCNPKTG